MKSRYVFALLILAALVILPFAIDAQDEKKPTPTKATYARGTRVVESQIIFKREGYVRGVQNIEITEALLGGFEADYIEFYLDGELVSIDIETPFAGQIDTGAKTAKRSIMVIAVREKTVELAPAADGTTTAADVDEEGFSINIVEPGEGSYVVGRTAILVEPSFTDDASLESVQIYVDGELVATLTEAPWEFIHNFGRSFNGRRVSVIAFDSYARRAEAAVTTAPLERSTVFVESRVVTLDVTVNDNRGKFIGGLDREDFEIYDNGQLQDIRYFSTEERPIWAAILIDTSGSMLGGKIRRSVFAAQQFIGQLKPADHAMVMTFGPDARPVSDFTNDFPELISKVGRINALKNAPTPLNQAIYNALENFKDRVGRRAIIVISDGADTASAITPNIVHEASKRADVRIYAIAIQQLGLATGRGFSNDQASVLLRGLADVTGGDSYFPYSSGEFLQIFKTIAEELRSQYSIGYAAPRIDDNDWRTIEVKVKGGRARTKQGYYPNEY